MSPTTITKTQLERRTALARLEVEELGAELEKAPAQGAEETLRNLKPLVMALLEALDVPIGLRVEQAARHLNVSKPTIKKWMDEGLLQRVPHRSPAEVTTASVLNVDRVLQHVRANFPARAWTVQLAAFLHDRDLQNQPWFRKGVEQRARGEYVEL